MAIQFPAIIHRNAIDGLKVIAQTIHGMLRDEEQPYRWESVETPGHTFGLVSATDAPNVNVTECALEFTATGKETIVGAWRLPNRCKFSGIVVPHLAAYHVTAAANTAASVTVWEMNYRWYNRSATTTGSWNTKTVTHTFAPAGRSHAVISFGSVTGSVTMTMGSIFKFQISRLGAHASDALDMSVMVDSVGISYQADINRGAELEDTKWSNLP